MKRTLILKTHLLATLIAVVLISTFFISSLVAEIINDHQFIKVVKLCILYALPLMVIIMPILAISGNKLAGASQSPLIKQKKGRMKLIMINGLLLITLALFLYFQSHFREINTTFLIGQMAELLLGMLNLILIGVNIRAGLKLSGKVIHSY